MMESPTSVHGTEKDKMNCSFYFKIGACRHGERCSRRHMKPMRSHTILIPNMFISPSHDPDCKLSSERLQEDFDLFYEDIFIEIAVNYGEIVSMNVCENLGDHLLGNVYIKFSREEEASRAVEILNSRFYKGRPIYAELSPVTEFKEARCRQHENGECTKGGFCNFMHPKHPTPSLKRNLFMAQDLMLRKRRSRRRSRN